MRSSKVRIEVSVSACASAGKGRQGKRPKNDLSGSTWGMIVALPHHSFSGSNSDTLTL